LAGVALFDRDREAPAHEGLAIHVWKRRPATLVVSRCPFWRRRGARPWKNPW
jgi:hypothetical protein